MMRLLSAGIVGLAFMNGFPAFAQKNNGLVDTMVFLNGQCDFRVNGQKLDCDEKMVYAKTPTQRIQISAFPTLLVVAAFSGGKDINDDPEHYFLTVDRLILSGGTSVPADGVCSMDLRKDGRRVYMVKCTALAHDGRKFEFNFKPQPKPPTIKHF
ncbi:hypothetical protein AMST5_03013 [freshwater sediment metagenome]|uniref:Uncharacterized protein n=1 Tax=freshwater sediment metagenome TaxID=556182 RepID=A0AA48M169_9ZZZZ